LKAHGKWLFCGLENVKGRFLIDMAPIYEIEYPFRFCEKAAFIRVSPARALVLGCWRQSMNLDSHLLAALGGRVVHFHEEKRRFSLGPEDVQSGQEKGLYTGEVPGTVVDRHNRVGDGETDSALPEKQE